jgi:hypothetical protein
MIYALKGDPGGFDILSFLRRGEGRFGWSYCSTADLHDLKSKIDASGWGNVPLGVEMSGGRCRVARLGG